MYLFIYKYQRCEKLPFKSWINCRSWYWIVFLISFFNVFIFFFTSIKKFFIIKVSQIYGHVIHIWMSKSLPIINYLKYLFVKFWLILRSQAKKTQPSWVLLPWRIHLLLLFLVLSQCLVWHLLSVFLNALNLLTTY